LIKKSYSLLLLITRPGCPDAYQGFCIITPGNTEEP
jgi:hypothetical protein